MDDLAHLRRYIEEDNLQAAARITKRVIETVDLLAQEPFMGKAGRVMGTREMVVTRTPVTVIYHVTPDVLSVLRVFHQARRGPDSL